MGDRLTSFAVIPARGGSKRIKRKNLRRIGGLPLVLWTARTARDSRLDHYVISTEDDEIADVCRTDGHDVLERPHRLAADHIWSAPVVRHAYETLSEEGMSTDLVCLLHPTSPFRAADDIDTCLGVAGSWTGAIISFTDDDLNGAIYVSRTWQFLEDGSFFHQPIWPYNMDAESGIDIDTPGDLRRARRLAHRRM